MNILSDHIASSLFSHPIIYRLLLTPIMSRTVLITGATGKQGGSVVAALLAAKADYQILALTRDASSVSAQRLAAKSSKITIVQGNLDEADEVFKTARKATSSPIWGVFSVQVRI